MFIAQYLKAHGNNTIVLDAACGDEQVDYTQWSQVFLSHPELFEYFDAYIVYQDFGKARKLVITQLQKGEMLWKISPENVLYRDKEGTLAFSKPSHIDENELFGLFTSYFYSLENAYWRPSTGYVHNMRMFPYKCYWSACHFCTINSSHLFPYNPTQTKRYIDALILFLKKNQAHLGHIYFLDEAVSPKDMLYFATELIKNDIKIGYFIRTRFEEAYSKENCKILRQSGLVLCGVGLEAATDAINISVNKGQNLTLADKLQIIKNFDEAQICLHIFSIVGFPHETTKEMLRTKLFLQHCFLAQKQVVYGVNIFGLNVGSYMAAHLDNFGIRLLPSASESGISFDLRLRYAQSPQKTKLTKDIQEELNLLQLLPWVKAEDKPSGWSSQSFWIFIFRTFRYYPIRHLFAQDIFKWYRDINISLLALSNADLYHTKVTLSPYLQFIDQKNDTYLVKEWSSFRSLVCTLPEVRFLQSYDENKTLGENLEIGSPIDRARVRIFLENYFLLSSRTFPDSLKNFVAKKFDDTPSSFL